MTKPIILVDSDQVLAQFVKKWLDTYNERYDDNLTEEEFAGTFGGVHEVVKPEVGKKIYDLMKEPGFFADLDIVPGAQKAIEKLMEVAEVYIVTAYSADGESAKGKVQWFEKHFPKIVEEERLILCKPKFLVYGDVLIDDSMENLEDWQTFMEAKTNTSPVSICVAQSHNAEAADNPLIDIRLSTWTEILEYLNMVLL